MSHILHVCLIIQWLADNYRFSNPPADPIRCIQSFEFCRRGKDCLALLNPDLEKLVPYIPSSIYPYLSIVVIGIRSTLN